MADTKISALTASTTPLAGTEVLPIVQGGVTKQVSVANLTAGRAVATAGGSFTDNFVQGTAAKGVNFTANTPAAGMTSQLLNWYEEGTWTPVVSPTAGSLTSYTSAGTYTKIGRVVTLQLTFTIVTTGTASGTANIDGVPFTSANTGNSLTAAGVGIEVGLVGGVYQLGMRKNAQRLALKTLTDGAILWSAGAIYDLSITYQTP